MVIRKLQIFISRSIDFHFVLLHFVSQTTVSPSWPDASPSNLFPVQLKVSCCCLVISRAQLRFENIA